MVPRLKQTTDEVFQLEIHETGRLSYIISEMTKDYFNLSNSTILHKYLKPLFRRNPCLL